MKEFLGRLELGRVHLPPLDAGRLKYFAVVTMLIDHAACAFLENAYSPYGQRLAYSIPNGMLLDHLLRMIGRQAFPIFCFFLVEGFFHTHNRFLYFVRLAVFTAVSQVPFQKCIFPFSSTRRESVMCTLALGLLAIWAVEELANVFLPARESADGVPGEMERPFPEDWNRGTETGTSVLGRLLSPEAGDGGAAGMFRRLIFLAAAGGTVCGFSQLANMLHTDYRYGGVILIVLLYLLREYRVTALFVSWLWLWWYNSLEMYAAPAFFMLACYNGKRGRQNKYFFYLFYPAHLTILWLLRRHFFGA